MFLAKWSYSGEHGVEKSGIFINAFLEDLDHSCGISTSEAGKVACNMDVVMDPGVGIVIKEGAITPELIDAALTELAEGMRIPLPVVGHSMGRHFQNVGDRIQDAGVGMENWIRYLYENPDEAVWVLQNAVLPEGKCDESSPYIQGAVEFLGQAVKLSPMQFLFLMQPRLDGIFIPSERMSRNGTASQTPELIVPKPTFSDAEMAATIRRLPPSSVVRLSNTVAMAIGQWGYDETADAMVQAAEKYREGVSLEYKRKSGHGYARGCYSGSCALRSRWLAGRRLLAPDGPTPRKGTPLWHLAWVLGHRGLSPAMQFVGHRDGPPVWDLALYLGVPLVKRPDSIMANPRMTDTLLREVCRFDLDYMMDMNIVETIRKVCQEASSPNTPLSLRKIRYQIPTQLFIAILSSPKLTPTERAILIARKAKGYELRPERYSGASWTARPKVMPPVPVDVGILDEVLDGVLVCEAAKRLAVNGAEFSLEPKDPVRIGRLVNRALREERPELKEALSIWMRWARAGTAVENGP
ncbi:MAG: hypothetical protein GYA36_19090 [Veillonellaceae bacterium]|nr:hypothetical protein [Veillonellaceae bacterium]